MLQAVKQYLRLYLQRLGLRAEEGLRVAEEAIHLLEMTNSKRVKAKLKKKSKEKSKATAPKGLLLDLLLPADQAEERVYNLTLAYATRWLPKHGPRWAKTIFLVQCFGTISRFYFDAFLVKTGLLKTLERYLSSPDRG
jgi:hypothetical protein